MRNRLIIFLLSLATCVAGQTAVFEATVVDARTHEALPFASVYVNKVSSTITNSVGTFSLRCDSSDVMRISYVGYQSCHIEARNLPVVVLLEPIEQTLDEVVVLPYPLKKFIRMTTKETLRQLQKFRKQESNFFYRQTAFNDSSCYELVEAFLTGRSAVSLRDLQLGSGRYAGIRSDSVQYYSYYANFFTFSQVDFASKYEWPAWGDDILPLFRHYDSYYTVDYDIIGNESDRLIALHFEPKPQVLRPILGATIYVDEKTLHVRKVEGQGRNIIILHTDKEKGKDSVMVTSKTLTRTNFDYVVTMTEERGFVEVQSVYVVEEHELYGERQLTRSILFNIGDKLQQSGGAQLKFGDNLHQQIEQRHYDPEFWRQNEIVRRTPVEQEVMELFEDKQLFGVWK